MKSVFALLFAVCAAVSVSAQELPLRPTHLIYKKDSPEMILQKAVHTVPTPNQLRALQREFVAFVHFGVNTFTRREWGDGWEDPKIFALKDLDTDQWCRAIKSAGMKMVILTVKHHDGFVLWQSRYTRHGIMATDFDGGRGDILASLSESCRKYGLDLGIYLSPADLYHIERPDGLYGNQSVASLREIPRKTDRPFRDRRTFRFRVDDYNEYFLNQLFELLTEYGDIAELWFDGAHPKRKGGQQYAYQEWRKLIRELAPNAVIFGREDLRWCGNEAGDTRATERNVIPFAENPDTMNHFPDLCAPELGTREELLGANYLHYQPAETNTSIREGWFYRDEEQGVRSADDVFDMWERAVGGNSILLLNIPPNREGRFSERDVKVLEEVGQRIRSTYEEDLLKDATDADKHLSDKDINTYCSGREFVVRLPKPALINRLVLQEPIARSGERVEEHAVDAWIGGRWHEIARATNIGYKRILRFDAVETSRLRVRIIRALAEPRLATLSAHYYRPRPPRIAISQSPEGLVSLCPIQSDFRWKPHQADAEATLQKGCTIRYRVNGGEEQTYTAPFRMDGGRLTACATIGGERGAETLLAMGLDKAGWRIASVTSSAEEHPAEHILDGNNATQWTASGEDLPQEIVLDLSRRTIFNGLRIKGMIAKGEILASKDNGKWERIATIDLGNLKNDPTPREIRLKKPAETRYIKLRATHSAVSTPSLSEIDLLRVQNE